MDSEPSLQPRTIIATGSLNYLFFGMGTFLATLSGIFLYLLFGKFLSVSGSYPAILYVLFVSPFFVLTLMFLSSVYTSISEGICIFRRLPKITIDKHGLAYTSAFRHRLWKWNDIGPLSISLKKARNKVPADWVVCAYLRANHDLLAAHNVARKPNHYDADIRISLGETPAGWNDDRAQAFADELNAWRRRYGEPVAPSNVQNSARRVACLQWKLFLKRQKRWRFPLLIGYVVFAMSMGL